MPPPDVQMYYLASNLPISLDRSRHSLHKQWVSFKQEASDKPLESLLWFPQITYVRLVQTSYYRGILESIPHSF